MKGKEPLPIPESTADLLETNISTQTTKSNSQSTGLSSEQSEADQNTKGEKPKKRKKKKLRFLLAPSSLFSSFLFLWIFKLIRTTLEQDQKNIIYSLSKTETAQTTGDNLKTNWNHQKTLIDPSLFKALFSTFGKSYLPLGLLKVLWIGFTWIGNYYFLGNIIKYNESINTLQQQQQLNAHLYCIGMFFCSFIGSLCFHNLTVQSSRIGIQCRAALMVLIYRKSLRLSYLRGGVGDIVNLISIESNHMAEAFVHFHYLWSAILECIVLFIFTFLNIGYAAFAPFGLLILVLFPLQYLFAVRSSSLSCKLTELITKRVHLMSEILTAIKLIKFFTWEGYYRKRISDMRQLELMEMRSELRYKIASFTVVFATPAAAISLALYTFKGEITPELIFTLLFLFNSLRYPLYFLPNSERNINGAQTSLKKLQEFFLLPEIDAPFDDKSVLDKGVCMKIDDADFIWDGDLDHPHIKDLNLTIKRGQVIAVVGDIGSGKALLASIMGQLKQSKGTVKSNGSTCGFIPHEPWFINATVRDNIVFGLEYNEKKYNDAIRISGLTRDIMMLSNRDESFVNDLNLSMPQKQRLSLARTIYQDPDIILMEDCLGDFDQGQAKQLFKESICNQLKPKKSIIMLTQQKLFLAKCDLIIVMQAGKIIERGSYDELKLREVNFSGWVTDVIHIEDDPDGLFENVTEIRLDPVTSMTHKSESPLSFSPRPPSRKTTRRSPLAVQKPINAETTSGIQQIIELNSQSVQNSQLTEHNITKMIERGQNSIISGSSQRPPANFANQDILSRAIELNQLTVHSIHDFDIKTMDVQEEKSFYLKPGIFSLAFLLLLFTLAHGFRFASDIWLTFIVDQKSQGDFDRNYFIFLCLSLAIILSILLRGFGLLQVIISKSSIWHRKILEAVLHAPMSFYDITPLGHILSFFSRHLFSVDDILPDTALQFLSFFPLVLGAVTIACVFVQWLWTVVPVILAAWFVVVGVCVLAQDEFQKLESINKSPLFAHLSSTLEGLFVIRLYKAEDRFDHFNRSLIDADHKALYSLLLGNLSLIVKSLMAACLDTISSVLIYFTALFCILFQVTPSHTGLAITNVLQLLLFVPWLVKMFYALNGSMNSINALIYFGENVPQEARGAGSIIPPKNWPDQGKIQFIDVTSRYQRYGVIVLKNVNFEIFPKEKIAIVGRSGSGKSTILMSLLRILEPSEGKILIDGIDTKKITLTALRSRIAVVPQEPVMLTGTIRTNLDPFHTSSDQEIWEALKVVHLAEKIKEMPNKLETPITENGRMFNISERQLFCIARAYLIKTSILVYDEPAVTVDRDTEHLIQQVINENFKTSTIIFLATRFRVIVAMDRVMVMKYGEIVEFDTPLNLLDNPKSKFSMMVAQTGEINTDYLKYLANSKKDTQSISQRSFTSLQSLKTASRSSSVPSRLENLFTRDSSVTSDVVVMKDVDNK